jgi:PIN domain nuclease of toxin-antitoxin system
LITSVLDASAVLALLRGEPGAERVADYLNGAAISSVILSEVVGRLALGGMAEAYIRDVLQPLCIACMPAEASLALMAGLLQPATQPAGLSLGDRFCLALARQLSVPAVTSDRAWANIAADVGVEVVLIR